jgi:hypothetical protein
MSASTGFPSLPLRLEARRLGLAFVAALGLLAAAPGTARADDNLLRGPHPFLKDNELSVHVLVGEGLGDALSGAKLALDYGYKLTQGSAPAWFNLEINVQHSGCDPLPAGGVCGTNTGDVVETLVGAKWKFATPLPLVPFIKAAAGMVFAFPNGASDAAGLALRGTGGVNYFFFDWLGLGVEVGYSVGRIDYDATYRGSHDYSVFDLGGGLELQF